MQFGVFGGIMDLEDFIVSNNILPIGSLIFLLFCSGKKHGWGWDKFIEECDQGKGVKFPKFMYYWLKYVAPILILLILILGWTSKLFG